MAEEKKQKYNGMNNVYSECSDFDDLMFTIRTALSEVNTAIPVKVVEVYVSGSQGPTGYVDVLPLVGFIDADGELIDMATLYHLPYFRLQGGIAAIVTDPVVGDIGLAVFAQRDSTKVVVGTDKTVTPGSFRKHSMSDGWYIGGFLCQKPKIFLELDQNEQATLTAINGVTINCQTGGLTINGDTQINGRLDVTGDVTAGNHAVTALGHTHTGVHGETSTGHG